MAKIDLSYTVVDQAMADRIIDAVCYENGYEDGVTVESKADFFKARVGDYMMDTLKSREVKDVTDTASRFIHPDDLVITIVGPADIIIPQLEGLGPVEVVPAI